MPHAEAWPESLWWFVHYPGDRKIVIDSYLTRYAHGKKIPQGFRDELLACLNALSRKHSLAPWGKPRTKLYWTIPNYARAHGHKPFTLMKRLRELKEVAKELFPERAAANGERLNPLTENEKAAIRLKYRDGVDVEDIATQFRIAESYVGRLCREERKRKRAEPVGREAEQPVSVAFEAPVGFEDPNF